MILENWLSQLTAMMGLGCISLVWLGLGMMMVGSNPELIIEQALLVSRPGTRRLSRALAAHQAAASRFVLHPDSQFRFKTGFPQTLHLARRTGSNWSREIRPEVIVGHMQPSMCHLNVRRLQSQAMHCFGIENPICLTFLSLLLVAADVVGVNERTKGGCGQQCLVTGRYSLGLWPPSFLLPPTTHHTLNPITS